jgi:glycosyltransferase involved in cell wall biosynthesis
MVGKRILYLVHEYHNLAGVEEFLKALVRHLPPCYEPWICFPHKGALHLGKPPIERNSLETFRLPFTPLTIITPLRDGTCEDSLAYVLHHVQPELIHIVHFASWPLSMFQQVLNVGCPTVLSFHDYYAITPYYTMQGCSDPVYALSKEYCQTVFKKDLSAYCQQRVRLFQELFPRMSAMVVPSEYLRRQLGVLYPDRFTVIPYGIEPFPVAPRMKTWSGFRFGFYGSLLPQKGWDSLIEPFQRIRARRSDVELHFFGGNGPEIPGVFYHGAFLRHQVSSVMTQCDVAFVPSRFAETYSMVLSELWRSGVPTAVAKIGAMGERVEDGKNGRTFTPDNTEEIFAVMEWFLTNSSWQQWQFPEPPTAPGMADQYHRLYEAVCVPRTVEGEKEMSDSR